MAGQGEQMATSEAQNAPRPQLPKILQACQQQAEQYVTALFKQVVDKLDDILFERGNKGGPDAEAYMDVARELRIKRQELFGEFKDAFIKDYKSRLKFSTFALTAKKESAQNSGLSLVDEQDLEEALAIDGLVAKANDRYRNEQYGLAQRFNHMIDGAKYDEEHHPLSPDTIAHAFRDSLKDMEWKVEVKLVVYKTFEQHALKSLVEFYQKINTLLCESGVLPELKLGVSIRSTGGGQNRSAAPQDEDDEEALESLRSPTESVDKAAVASAPKEVEASSGAVAAADVYQTLQQLMNVKKFGGDPGETMPGTGGTAGPVVSMPADDLVRGLSLLQQNALPVEPGAPINVAIIKEALMSQMQQLGDDRGINPAHDNTIDVIGMIFEFILDEPSTPDVVKNLLNRLQIPILKVAIVDKAFFANKTHPARRLLNVLGHASIGWNDNSEDARQRRFEKMEYVVNRVLNEFEQDPGIFATLLEEFGSFLADEGADTGEEEVAAEEGQVEEESPDRLVFEIIESQLEGVELPEILRVFLRGTWHDVLQQALDQDGQDSDNWRRREQVMADLMWSVEPKTSAEDRRKMVMLLPRLLDELRNGMTTVACSSEEIDGVLDALEPIHMACLHGEAPPQNRPSQEATKPVAEVRSSAEEVADMIRSIQQGMGDGDEDMFKDVVDADQDANGDLMDMDGALGESEQIDDEFTTMASEMKLGTWLEFDFPEKKRRGKLAWKSVVMGEYVFVDRRYKVVAERTLSSLAADLREGRATLVEDVAMFDRALDKVLNGLMSGSSTEH